MSAPRRLQTPTEVGERVAPAGGPSGGRGCASFLILALVLPVAAAAQPVGVALPSGQTAVFEDVITEEFDRGRTMWFRFVAPWIAQAGTDLDAVAADMAFLCDAVIQPRLAEEGAEPARIVVTLMSEVTEFGVSNPETVQFFETFSLSDGVCIWEVF